ncbi:hypothetical protein NEDG_01467 [Nematocida displodere]|uniref:Uncharacterized protein n=1 Tax=Nematocida displodere TaxID=1805483 RepID=A0A177EET8_9MICR|nr:hypothetical protein NEDG_01467 [Nematocida displodere]
MIRHKIEPSTICAGLSILLLGGLLQCVVYYQRNKPEQTQNMELCDPEVLLPLTKYTHSTIALFTRCGSQIKTLESLGGVQLVKLQPNPMVLYLDQLTLKDIPEKLEPGIVFRWLTVMESKTQLEIKNPGTTHVKLCQLLRCLSTVKIETLVIEKIGKLKSINPKGSPRIPLTITQALTVRKTSVSFFEWFCNRVDLSRCTNALELSLVECDTQSIKCLNSLGLQQLSGLFLERLHQLMDVDYQVLRKGHVKDRISITSIPKTLKLPNDLAKLIKQKRWKKAWLDACLWAQCQDE